MDSKDWLCKWEDDNNPKLGQFCTPEALQALLGTLAELQLLPGQLARPLEQFSSPVATIWKASKPAASHICALAMAVLPEARMQTVKNLRHSVGAFGFYRQPSVFFCRNSSLRVIKLSENIQKKP